MNKLKDKFESYTVSTVEENQRAKLLDNLASSIENANDFAEENIKVTGVKAIDDKNCISELCNSLLAILSHELKAINVAEKPSFWFVVERISPKDTVQMIYRLRIRQSDSARCDVWIKHALSEGTIGSYFSLLEEDVKILRQNYKSTAFVRDTKKMESAKNLIEMLISSVQFNIEIEGSNSKENQSTFPKQFGSFSSSDTYIKQHNKGRESPNNVVIIQDSSPSSNNRQYFTDTNKTLTQSLPGDFLTIRGIYRPNMLPAESKESSPRLSPNFSHSPISNSLKHGKYDGSPRLTLNEVLRKGNIPLAENLEISDSSDNSLSSSVDSCHLNKNNVIVNKIKVVSDGGSPKSLESTLNIIVKDQNIKHISTTSPPTRYVNADSIKIISNQQPKPSEKNLSTDCSNLHVSEHLSLSARIEAHSANELIHTIDNSSDKSPVVLVQSELSPKSKHQNSLSYENNKCPTDIPTLNVCGTLNPSQNSAFDPIKNKVETDVKKDVISFHKDSSENEAPEVPENEICIDKQSSGQPSIDSSLSDSIEENYRNQDNEFKYTIPLEGSSQLSNVLNNVSVPVSSSGDYFIPGIHSSCDIQSCESSIKHDDDNDNLESSVAMCIPPVSNSVPTNSSNSNNSHSSPSTLSTLSSKLFEKTLFGKTLGSSFSSDKGSNSGQSFSDNESECSAGQSFSMLVDLGVAEDFIGMKEDHFSTPDTFMGFSSLEELENAIASCKQLINSSPEKSKRRDELVTQLVQLRLKQHELKNGDPSPKDGKKVLGHQFFKQGSMSSTLECDACAATIFPLLQRVFVCKDCGFHCHEKCLNILEKPCVHSQKLVGNSTCELRICPEISLAAQQYRCADCFKRIPSYDGQFEVRLCDYTGQKYCSKCHWNDMCVIPARVVHNWDFSLYSVSRQSKHLLLLLSKKPDIKLQSLNSVLFNFVDELRDVRTLRQQIMMMKKYMVSCRVATEERLLLLLQNRQHFVDSSEVYSLQDLLDVHCNILLNELSRIHASFGKHIKFDCLLCQGKGFICEFCNAEEIIFPFDNHVTGCVCSGIFHRQCYTQSSCPKCLRIKKKKFIEDV